MDALYKTDSRVKTVLITSLFIYLKLFNFWHITVKEFLEIRQKCLVGLN